MDSNIEKEWHLFYNMPKFTDNLKTDNEKYPSILNKSYGDTDNSLGATQLKKNRKL